MQKTMAFKPWFFCLYAMPQTAKRLQKQLLVPCNVQEEFKLADMD